MSTERFQWARRRGLLNGAIARLRMGRDAARRRTPSIEEQVLAQAVDAQDLQVRLLALERACP